MWYSAPGGSSMVNARTVFAGAFWVVAALDAIGSLALIFASEGNQDAAGRGMQSGFGIILLLMLVAMVVLWWFVRTLFVRVPVFVVLLMPGLFIATV